MSCDIDTERRFGGLDRLYGPGALDALRAARATVVGLGGVGSWTAEALARCGIGTLTLVDLDHIAESNINRQVHALGRTVGQAKVDAMAERIRDIHPQCVLNLVDDFLDPDNAARLLEDPGSVVVDCTDQVAAKIAMILHARRTGAPLVVCGGAGGKTDPLALRAGDLSEATNDALLAKIRNQLRRHHGYPKAAPVAGKPPRRIPKMKIRALWVDQPARLPAAWAQDVEAPAEAPQGLSCAGYGSAVTVTAAMGLAAAHEVLRVVFPAER
ncbi:MAG: tRNA threonylcarbamoyladenosine dehydratase [Pigmentiphaga sp.]|uniref:tRNA threonylcarbamoyladenosine dehydratase n=1 Tax=Pigmentiphaga sp. TaxID=1977564 RepID=UPI0029A16F87|nr:tRNA threonylcarbamoyladenosine dehydratase [Pigmentiphaga sp.]MDX3904724.1 tRNA threonylcarbamoyladenosine dehydratase [Pigmentiphaga sp.]